LGRRPLDGLRIEGTQVGMGSSRIDVALVSTEGLGRKFGLEVKGYTDKTFRDAVNAFIQHENKTPELRALLDAETRADFGKIERMLKQLNDAKSFTKNPPYLAVTDELSGPTRNKLQGILDRHVPDTEIVYLEEWEIKEVARRYAAGLGVPEVEKAAAAGKLPEP
jgi:hypothetical protein